MSDEYELKPASTLTVNFAKGPDIRQHKSGKIMDKQAGATYPIGPDGKSLNPKQIRARARRKAKRGGTLSTLEIETLYNKPIEEWDDEEIARGRPRNPRTGDFTGGKPKFLTRALQEEALTRFTNLVKEEMQVTTIGALKLLKNLIENEEVDDRGRPVVPASTKLDASKFLIEHVIGKPKQRIESDVSVKLQSILAQVMVNPADALRSQEVGGQGYVVGHLPGVTMPMGEAASDDIIDAEFEEHAGEYG